MQLCDLVVGVVVPVESRIEWMDFLHGYLEWSSSIIIPKPEPFHSNIGAIVKPLQSWVCDKLYDQIRRTPSINLTEILLDVGLDWFIFDSSFDSSGILFNKSILKISIPTLFNRK